MLKKDKEAEGPKRQLSNAAAIGREPSPATPAGTTAPCMAAATEFPEEPA